MTLEKQPNNKGVLRPTLKIILVFIKAARLAEILPIHRTTTTKAGARQGILSAN